MVMYDTSLVAQDELRLKNYVDDVSPFCTVSLHSEDVDLCEHTNSINRGFSHLDSTRFVLYAAGLCWLRTALQQPLNIALARQQTCHFSSCMRTMQIIRRIYTTEGGVRGLTQGMTALTLGCALSEAIYLGLFEYGRERFPIECDATRDAVSGYISDAICRLVHLPLSIVALRQMTEKKTLIGGLHKTTDMFRTLKLMYYENGMRTVFAGYGSTLLIGCQWTAVWWAMYGYTKSWLYNAADEFLEKEQSELLTSPSPSSSSSLFLSWKQWLLVKDDNIILNSLASIFTSVSTAVLFNPYLVVRSNLQVTPNARLWGVTCDVYRVRGIRGFYRGLALNIGTCLIDGVLASTSYEYAKLWSDRTQMR